MDACAEVEGVWACVVKMVYFRLKPDKKGKGKLYRCPEVFVCSCDLPSSSSVILLCDKLISSINANPEKTERLTVVSKL